MKRANHVPSKRLSCISSWIDAELLLNAAVETVLIDYAISLLSFSYEYESIKIATQDVHS